MIPKILNQILNELWHGPQFLHNNISHILLIELMEISF